jgi:hypothetical protein
VLVDSERVDNLWAAKRGVLWRSVKVAKELVNRLGSRRRGLPSAINLQAMLWLRQTIPEVSDWSDDWLDL